MAYDNVALPTAIYKFINCVHNGLSTEILDSEQNSDKITDCNYCMRLEFFGDW